MLITKKQNDDVFYEHTIRIHEQLKKNSISTRTNSGDTNTAMTCCEFSPLILV